MTLEQLIGQFKAYTEYPNQDTFVVSNQECKDILKYLTELQNQKVGHWKTYDDIYDEFRKKFPLAKVLDYRPAVELHIPQIKGSIPNAIVVWLNDGSTVIYITESEEGQ